MFPWIDDTNALVIRLSPSFVKLWLLLIFLLFLVHFLIVYLVLLVKTLNCTYYLPIPNVMNLLLWFMVMCGGLPQFLLIMDINFLWCLLMIILDLCGFSLWNINSMCSKFSSILKLLLRTNVKRRSICFNWILKHSLPLI